MFRGPWLLPEPWNCALQTTSSHLKLRCATSSKPRCSAAVPDIKINGTTGTADCRTPAIYSSPVYRRKSLAIALDMKGIAVSTGSACSSGSTEPSHVLLAMGRSREEARSSVRFSFGRYNTRAEDVSRLLEAVVACVRQLRHAKQETRLVGA